MVTSHTGLHCSWAADSLFVLEEWNRTETLFDTSTLLPAETSTWETVRWDHRLLLNCVSNAPLVNMMRNRKSDWSVVRSRSQCERSSRWLEILIQPITMITIRSPIAASFPITRCFYCALRTVWERRSASVRPSACPSTARQILADLDSLDWKWELWASDL